MENVPQVDILGVKVDDIDEEITLSHILKLAKDAKGHHQVVTINAEFVMLARRDREFAKILEGADVSVADGQWIVWSKLILGGKAQSRVTGVDLVERLCSESAKQAITVGFLGGFGSVASEVSKRQQARNPGLKVGFAGPGDDAIGPDLRLNKPIFGKKRVDILFVAYGMGRQEFWIARNIKNLDVGVAIGVGGAFDYLSSVKTRAPGWMQSAGLEWLWRLTVEPTRIWRMRVLPVYFVLVLGQFLKERIFDL
ncbi:MAG: WecB/TagA/CpsF family glycosyltransferase [Candidatus Curtissbacteria bacterium]